MFEKYINYNQVAEEMIRNREDNLAALTSLCEQFSELEQSEGFRSMSFDNDRVQKSIVGDAVINMAIRRESLKSQISDLDLERKLYDKAWDHLSDEERQVLEIFFKKGMKKQDAIDCLCETFEREPATIYRRKDSALKRFKQLLFG